MAKCIMILSRLSSRVFVVATLTLRFMDEDTMVAQCTVPYGGSLADEDVPVVPAKEGNYGEWDTTDFTNITFDMTINAEYSQLVTARESGAERDGRAILLMEGSFTTTEALTLTESSDAPTAVGSYLESWTFDPEGDTSHTMRYLAPDGPDNVEVYLQTPDGWQKAEMLTVFGLAPGRALPLPAADEALWAQLVLDREPAAMDVARALYPEDTAKQEDFYSELCSKRARGKALAWTLQRGSETVCTVGAYALANGQAYMACGQTARPLRGKGIGGRLIVRMANELAAEGYRPVFLCSPERVHFYTRLGFAKLGEYAKYKK